MGDHGPLAGRLSLDTRAADRDVYLKLAGDLESFLATLRGRAVAASTEERQRVLRLLVKDVLVGPEKITIRHRIPVREHASGGSHHATGEPSQSFRTLILQELLDRGILAPSFVGCAAHDSAAIEQTVDAVAQLMRAYRRALESAVENVLRGRPVRPTLRPRS